MSPSSQHITFNLPEAAYPSPGIPPISPDSYIAVKIHRDKSHPLHHQAIPPYPGLFYPPLSVPGLFIPPPEERVVPHFPSGPPPQILTDEEIAFRADTLKYHMPDHRLFAYAEPLPKFTSDFAVSVPSDDGWSSPLEKRVLPINDDDLNAWGSPLATEETRCVFPQPVRHVVPGEDGATTTAPPNTNQYREFWR